MIPALGRIKRAVREAVSICGGIDGAAATASRGRSVVGDWNNLNHAAFPPLDCVLALDEVSVAAGSKPAVLMALAQELGHVAIQLPSVNSAAMNLGEALIAAMAEFGDIAAAIQTAQRDGKICEADCAEIRRQIHEAQASLALLDALYAMIAGAE